MPKFITKIRMYRSQDEIASFFVSLILINQVKKNPHKLLSICFGLLALFTMVHVAWNPTVSIYFLSTKKCNKHTCKNQSLSHNNPCFQCNTAVMNFLISNTSEIRFHDINQSTVPMYSYAKILKHGQPTWTNDYVLDPYFSV